MPKYDFSCQDCGTAFEVKLSFSEVDEAQPACPNCASTQTERHIGRINFVGGGGSRIAASAPTFTAAPT